ncbi:Polyprotein pp220 [Talaromyces islandicus]|uniref:Polyprotein pp220 n=1 Tax=Talaromyces islandicus TaxID=28573 RepID=A0A0U1M9N8_TALIS|nr:Polyprotein pp220 [Talaromyces islandicus]
MAFKALSHGDYTVGWVCALPKEQTAAMAMLDETHADLPKPQHDSNAYTLGRIGQHNVVIACLPMGMIGNNNSATVAAHMLSTFPSIKFNLLVGIGGGVPPKVRLGDIVVSKPVGRYSGVVQWDYGKAGQGNSFERTGSLNSPPAAVLTALTKLQSKHDMQGSEIPYYLENLRQKWPKLAPQYLRSDSLQDLLFRSSYHHVEKKRTEDDDSWEDGEEEEEQESCFYCDLDQVVKRKPATRDMRIHYGLIASGNQVIKDAVRRNEINKMFDGNVLCFEMEAAGLINDFTCLVIRGICDYADSHKNKDWQEHAAAVAAAFAKEFLSMVPAHDVEVMPTIESVYGSVQEMTGNISTLTERYYNKEQRDILDWLSPTDYFSQHSDFIRKRQSGTGKLLLHSNEFQGWITQQNRILFCPGIPGSGKTMTTSSVIDYLHARYPESNTVGIAYIYCNFRRQEEHHSTHLLLNLLKQFSQGRSILPQCVKDLYEKHHFKGTRPSIDEISDALASVIAGFRKPFVIIDALDECKTPGAIQSEFLYEIFHLQAKTGASLFATSRHIPEIEDEFKKKGAVFLEIRASDGDIKRYLDGNTSRLPLVVQENPKLEEVVKTSIIRAADGMFLLATLHLDSLEDKVNLRQVAHALEELPKGTDAYYQAYEEAMERIQSQKQGFRDLALKTLLWISCARRPLSPRELQHALAVINDTSTLDEASITKAELIVSVCAGLVTIDRESNIVCLVHYTAQEYFQTTRDIWFPNAEADIAKACITYLSFDTFRSAIAPTHEAFDERLQLHPFYGYAAVYWGYHCRVASLELSQVMKVLEDASQVFASSQLIMRSKYDFLYRENLSSRFTAVHIAAYFGLAEATAALCEKGHDPDSKAIYEQTPLFWAAKNGHETIVKMLIDEYGVDINFKPHDGKFLTWAASIALDMSETLLLELSERLPVGPEFIPYLKWKYGEKKLVPVAVYQLLSKKYGPDFDSRGVYREIILSWVAQRHKLLEGR